jgi:hypothetical protein
MNRKKRLFPITSVALVSLLLGISHTAALSPSSDCRVRFKVVLATQHSAIDEARDFVIRDEESWCDFWYEVHAWIYPRPECPSDAVDFSKEVVIVSALGPRPNSCYGNAITQIDYTELSAGRRRRRDRLIVHVEDVIPEPSCLCFCVVVHPVYVVKVKKPVTDVSFVHHEKILECD